MRRRFPDRRHPAPPLLAAIPLLAAAALLAPARSTTGDETATEPAAAEVERLLVEGRMEEAEQRARRLLAAAEGEHGDASPAAAEALNLLVETLWKGGAAADPATAELAERAVERSETLFGDSLQLARALRNAGAIRNRTGRAAEARELLQRAAAMAERSHPEPPQTLLADCLNELGTSFWRLADYDRALESYQRTLDLRRRDLGPEDPSTGTAHGNVAIALESLQRPSEARSHFERAVAIQRAARPDHVQTAAVLNNYGLFLYRLGDHAAAREAQRQALEIRRRVFPPDHPQIGYSLNNLGMIERAAGDLAEAARLYQEALRIKEKGLGAEHPSTANSRNNLANVLMDIGGFDRSAALHRENLDLRIEALGEGHPDVAWSHRNLATALYLAGRPEEAYPHYRRALEIRRAVYGGRDRWCAESLIDLARAAWALGRPEALDLALEAEAVGREVLGVVAQGMTEREALRFAAWRPSGLPVLLTLAAEAPGPAETRRIWTSLAASRAAVLDRMARRNRLLRARGDAATAALLDDYAEAVGRLAELALGDGGAGGEEGETPGDQRREALRRKEELERRLAASSRFLEGAFTSREPAVSELAVALPEGAALVAYVRYLHQLPPPAARAAEGGAPVPLPEEERYLAFVLPSPSSAPVAVPLGPARAIDDAVRRWREQVARRPGVAVAAADAEREAAAAGAELARRIWTPVAARLGRAEAVFVVPDGALHLVSWVALPARGRTLLETGPLLHYLSAERDLLAPAPAGGRETGAGLLVLGDPSFDGPSLFAELRDAGAGALGRLVEPAARTLAALSPFRGHGPRCEPFASRRFEPLPATSAEARVIAELWPDAGDEPPPVLRLTGLAATEANLKAAAPGRRVVHLATHGFFLGGVCASALEKLDSETPVLGDNPLLLSGLALAGANQRAAATGDEEDGILTAGEIATLDLGGVEWVVLSGCDTGVGKIEAGEGVLGLRRALRIAGARTTIMSLWPVEDQATRRWMEALYRQRLEHGRPTHEAVRGAALEVLERRRTDGESTHPFYWAGFVAAGEWR